MQNRVTLKNIKINQALSEETPCYSATVYFDGKKVGETGNRGHGGCDEFRATDRERANQMFDFIKTLPDVESDIGGEPFTYKRDLDSVCAELLDRHEMAKEAKRMVAKKVSFYVGDYNGSFRYFSTAKIDEQQIRQHIAETHPNAVILNDLSLDDRINLVASV